MLDPGVTTKLCRGQLILILTQITAEKCEDVYVTGLHSRRSVSSSSPPATNQKALDPGTREHLTRLGEGPEKRNTDLEPNRVNISRRLEGTHSESPEARPEVRTRPRV